MSVWDSLNYLFCVTRTKTPLGIASQPFIRA